MPRGICAPSRVNSSGRFRKSTISCSSSFASSTPATSLNVTFTSVSATSLAFERPTDSSPPPKPPPRPPIIAREANIQMPTNSSGGRIHDSSVPSAPASVECTTELHIVLCQLAREVGRHLDGGEVGAPVRHRLGQRAVDHVARDRDLLDLVGIQILLELAVRDHVRAAAPASAVGEQAERRDHHQSGDDQPDRGREIRFRRRHAMPPDDAWDEHGLSRASVQQAWRHRAEPNHFFTTCGVLVSARAIAQPRQV